MKYDDDRYNDNTESTFLNLNTISIFIYRFLECHYHNKGIHDEAKWRTYICDNFTTYEAYNIIRLKSLRRIFTILRNIFQHFRRNIVDFVAFM